MVVNTSGEFRRRPGRPARITAEQVVAAAIEIGLEDFSVDEIANRLGVTTPALYSHVDGRDDILRRAAARVLHDLEPELDSLETWDAWLRAWASGIRDRLGAIGEDVLEAVRTSVDETALRITAHGLRLLIDAGLDPAEAGYALWLALRIACTAGSTGRPSLSGPFAQTAAVPAPSSAIVAARDRCLEVGTDSWSFDLEVLIAGLAAQLVGSGSPSAVAREPATTT